MLLDSAFTQTYGVDITFEDPVLSDEQLSLAPWTDVPFTPSSGKDSCHRTA
jgi:hypothetical protein